MSCGEKGRRAARVTGALAVALLATGCAARAFVGPPSHELPGPWEHHTVEVPDRVDGAPLRMHYLAAGPEGAPRVVLVHGFPDLSYGWRHVLPLLAREYRVLAPDLRGYGGTDKPDSTYAVREMGRDVAGFIEATSRTEGRPTDDKVHLIAHDWGAASSWWVAIGRPDLLHSYTALSVPHPQAWFAFLEEDREQRRRTGYQRLLASPGIAQALAGYSTRQLLALYRADLVHPEAFSEEHLQVYSDALRTAADWRPPLAYYKHLVQDADANAAAASAAPPVAVPTLMLWGEQDGFLFARQAPLTCRYVAPGPCEVEVFSEAGHWIQWDAPEALVQRWRSFVAGLAPH